jgi:hypothetical protein
MTELNGYTFFDAEFVIGHRSNTVPERSGVALSFRGRPTYRLITMSGKLYGEQQFVISGHNLGGAVAVKFCEITLRNNRYKADVMHYGAASGTHSPRQGTAAPAA